MERTQKVKDGGSKDESEEAGGKVNCNRGLHDLATNRNRLLNIVIKARKCRVRIAQQTFCCCLLQPRSIATPKRGAKVLQHQRSARYAAQSPTSECLSRGK